MFNKIKLMLDKINENHPLGVIILILIMMILDKEISGNISFYIGLCLFVSYQLNKKLGNEIKVLKKELTDLKTNKNL